MKNNGVDLARFNEIKARYQLFLDAVNEPGVEPVTVFDPLPKRAIDELVLIREVSMNLQAKKDEDVKKAAQAAQEQEEKDKEAADTKTEEQVEEKQE